MNKNFETNNVEETHAVAANLVADIPDGSVIALHGELGAGKTCFVQGIAHSLNIQEPVTSPTFTIINEYRGSRNLYHIDLYRLNDTEEMEALGLDDYLYSDGITAIEWANRAIDLLPSNTVHVDIKNTDDPDHRIIQIKKP